MPKVSVLLATYNSGPYVAELIESILRQTHSDLELIIRDDKSDDDTATIAASFFSDGRIRFIDGFERSGSAQNNFFRLLLSCEGDYIMLADADDVWLPHKIEKTLERMREQESLYGADTPILVHSNLSVVSQNLSVIADSFFEYEKLSPERKSLRELLAQNNVTGCTVMINKALRLLVEEQPESSVMHDWWLSLIASAFGRISVIYEPLILYRQHGGNSVGAYNASDLRASAEKLSKRGRMKAVYASMEAQAACFAETFCSRLTSEKHELCLAYASLANKGKLARIATIFKYRFYKNTFLRNIGQLLVI